MNCQALSAAFEPMQNWALLAVLRNMWTGWMRTYHVFFHSLLSIAVIALGSLSHSYASNKSVPFHFLFSTENASLSLLLFFSWISHNYQSYTKASVWDCFSPVIYLCQPRANFEDAVTNLWPGIWIAVKKGTGCVCQLWHCQLYCWMSTKPSPSQTKPTSPKHLLFFFFESSSTYKRKELSLLYKLSEANKNIPGPI